MFQSPCGGTLTHGDQVAVVLQHDIPAEVLQSGVQLLPLLQGEVHKHVLKVKVPCNSTLLLSPLSKQGGQWGGALASRG